MVAARVWPEFAGDSGDIAGDASVTIEKGRIRIRVRGMQPAGRSNLTHWV
jgi:hypothetical protein